MSQVAETLAKRAQQFAESAASRLEPGHRVVCIVVDADGDWLGCGSNTSPSDVDAILRCAIDAEDRVDYYARGNRSEALTTVGGISNHGEFVCTACRDSHKIEREGKPTIMCVSCPSPCPKCIDGSFPYCSKTPCPCECHRIGQKEREESGHAD